MAKVLVNFLMSSGEKVEKPWGYEIIWAKTTRYVGKTLVIYKGHRLSFQYHEKKEETIRLDRGIMELEVEGGNLPPGRHTLLLKAGDTYHIPPLLKHRM